MDMPPRYGKSELVSRRLPAFILGKHPDDSIIAASYGSDLASMMNRDVQRIIDGNEYPEVFSDTKLHGSSNKTQEQEGYLRNSDIFEIVGHKGYYKSAGVGGSITGMGCKWGIIDDPCVAEGQRVLTSCGLKPIESIDIGDTVLTHRGRWRRVLAVHDNGCKEVIQATIWDYKILATPEHLVYTPYGWQELQHAEVVYGTVRSMWSRVKRAPQTLLQQKMPCGCSKVSPKNMQLLRENVSTTQRDSPEVLQPGMRQGRAKDTQTTNMRGLRGRIFNKSARPEVLLGSVSEANVVKTASNYDCRYSTSPNIQRKEGRVDSSRTHEWGTESKLPSRVKCELPQTPFQKGAIKGNPHDRRTLFGMRRPHNFGRASYRRKQNKRCRYQLDNALQIVPYAVSQIKRCGIKRVYDLTVEEDHSFIAEGIAVHNCKNRAEAESIVYRNAVWSWYTSTFYTRLEKDARILITATRWHEDDLVGRLLKLSKEDPNADQWTIFSLPAIADGKLMDCDPRQPGDPLWPDKYPLSELLKTKVNVGSYEWAALYQQTPSTPSGNILNRSWWKYYKQAPARFDEIIQSWDCTFKETSGTDYAVGQVWGRVGPNKYLLDQVRARMDFPATIAAIRNLTAKWPLALAKLVEDKANGPAVIATLKREIAGLIPIEPEGGKVVRAWGVSPDIEAGNVWLPEGVEWVNDFVEECANFPNGPHDDQVDAMSQALNRMINNVNSFDSWDKALTSMINKQKEVEYG